MQRRCQSCSAEVPENAKFCRGCGGKLEEIIIKKEEHQCPDCGKEIQPGAKFCRHCGSKLTLPVEKTETVAGTPTVIPENPKGPICVSCGGELNKTSKFCRTCGAAVSGAVKGEDKSPTSAKQSLKPTLQQVAVSSSAPEVPGESVFQTSSIVSAASRLVPNAGFREASEYIGPARIIFSGGWHLFTGLFAALKSPGKLIPGILLGFVWLVVSTLPALDITLPGQNIVSWLIFAQGGLQGGVLGAVGGVLGKGVFAGVLMGLFTRGNRKRSAPGVKSGGVQGRGSLGLLLMGMGLALILFNFFTWDNSLENSMIGVVAAVGTLRALGRENGFLRRLITALAQRFSPKRMAGTRDIASLGAGLSAGFALGVSMSLIASPTTGYVMGVISLLPGMLIAMMRKPREAVKSA